MIPDKMRARIAAQKVLDAFGVKRVPVPVERIIKSKDIMLEYAPLDEELSGMAYNQDGISIIGINALHHPNRQRFSAAHELGHHVLHAAEIQETVHVSKGLRALRRDPVSSQGSDPLEIDANTFASELLIPEKFLLEEIGPDGLDMEDDTSVEKLAKKFRVSVAAMKYRLSGLI
ncbi:ImmA/IrrE family metallo-endopeptidase [Litoreibacter sp.]|nr:ImmA/IrrE family metallo-endopeptidase [Litoreibacter sp.]